MPSVMLTRLECVSRKGDNESYNLQDSVTLLGTLKLDLECLETQIKLPCWQALSMGLHVGQSGKYPKVSENTERNRWRLFLGEALPRARRLSLCEGDP